MASLSLDVQRYSSRAGVVEIERRALRMVEAVVYVRVGPITVIDLAHLGALLMFPPLLIRMDYERSLRVSCFFNFPAFDVLLANSERVVTPSRYGSTTACEGLRCRVTLRCLSFSVRPGAYNKSGLWFAPHDNLHCSLVSYM